MPTITPVVFRLNCDNRNRAQQVPIARAWRFVPPGTRAHMSIAAAIIIALVVSLTAVLVLGLFVWAAIKDGEKDRATQARLGIRRKTRLGR
jgi:hypothetical protein